MTAETEDSWADLAWVIAAEGPPPDDHEHTGLDDQAPPWLRSLVPGGSFILDASENPEPLWGRGTDVLLADGEALMIAGGQGLGKSTLAQQLALGRAGFRDFAGLLGYPITPGSGRVLILAMDRPRQIARSLRRMVGEVHRAELDQRVVVWQGPPPLDLARNPPLLARMAEHAGADTVIVDSLKDAAVGLNDDEVGAGWNRARQTALRDGVQVVELHHVKKGGDTLDGVYGSTWLTSGAGSVLLLTGAAGDLVVNVNHVKQPAEVVGPLRVLHDHAAGRSSIHHRADLVAAAAAHPDGITVRQAASLLDEVDKPTAAQMEKARRRLEAHVREDRLRLLVEADPSSSQPARYGVR